MSSKRKKSSLSQSSVSGSELSDAGRQLELSVSKKHKRSNSSGSSDGSNQSRSRSRSKSGSGSGSDSGTHRSKSGSKSRSESRERSRSGSGARSRSSSRHSESDKKSGSGSDSGTGGSDKKEKSDASRQSERSGKAASDGSHRSSGSEKSKKLLKASERKASSKMQSTLSNDSDSENEDKVPKQKSKKIPKKDKKNNADLKIINSWRDEFDDGLDSDLIGDDDDRDALEEMTEKQREEELFKRAERREELKKRFEISKKLRLQNKDKPQPSRSPSVSEQSVGSGSGSGSNSQSDKEGSRGEDSESFSAFPQGTEARRKGYEEKHAKKFSALTNLKAIREEKERKEKERMEKESKHSKKKKNLSESESGSDLEKMGKSKQKKMKASDIYSSSSSGGEEQVRRKSSSSSSSSSSVSSISSGESDTERHKSKKVVKKAKNIETREELEKIRLSRFKLDKFVHLPIFKKTVIGCFVRIGIGHNKEKNCPVYRVAEITDVCETAKVYDVMKSRTNIGLRMRHGKQERVFRAQFISNQPFTESEFVKWKQTCEAEHVELPTNQHIAEKIQAIQKALTYRYSSYDVDKILASKEKFSKHPHNYAMYKAKLMKERDQYIDMGNQEEVERLDQKLADHEERAEELDRKRTSTIATISLINDRNRKNNIIRAEKNIKSEVERVKREGKVDDPFTRRKTLPVLSMPKSKIEEEPEMTSELLMKLQEEKKKAAEFKEQVMKQREADVMPKKQEKKSLSANASGSQDIFNAHDFDIDINVAEMGDSMMPSSIALKPVTTSSAASTGPTKRSLKIEEWKKKRGII